MSEKDIRLEGKSFRKEDLAELYAKSVAQLKEGQIVKGKIVKINNKNILVDIGYKSEGIVHISEFRSPKDLKIGDEIDLFLESKENEEGMVVLSKEKAERTKGWEYISSSFKEGDNIEGAVAKKIKGGFIVNIGLDAFLPASLAAPREFGGPHALMGKTMQFKIVKISRPRRNIVLSRKDFLMEEREESRKKIIDSLKKGAIVKGTVKNITDFGAFVDIGGIIGLLHVTDMSWGRIPHPSEAVSVGEEIEVVILNFNKEGMKVSLGLKQKTPNPWDSIESKYTAGQKVKGRIVNLMPYGAFVELEKGIEGLVHISELSWSKKYNHPNELLTVDQTVEVMVLDMDKQNKKISLSLKQLQVDPWTGIEDRYEVSQKVKGKVISLTDYGVFVELENGIDGLVHVSDISWTKKIANPRDVFKKDLDIETIILSVDEKNRRIALGIKQLQPDPWDEISSKFAPGTIARGKVTNITNFGIFVEIDKDLEGLLHVSEANLRPDERLEEKFKIGDEVDVKVLRVDGVQKKIALSRRDMKSDEAERESN